MAGFLIMLIFYYTKRIHTHINRLRIQFEKHTHKVFYSQNVLYRFPFTIYKMQGQNSISVNSTKVAVQYKHVNNAQEWWHRRAGQSLCSCFGVMTREKEWLELHQWGK